MTFPDQLSPKLLSSSTLSGAVWTPKAKLLAGVSNGSPATLSPTGSSKRYEFRAYQEFSQSEHFRAAFVMAWRTMRDGWYDKNLGNRNWMAIRRKYEDAAAECGDPRAFADIVQYMLGELNGSHLGFFATGGRSSSGGGDSWSPVTAHLGLRFEDDFRGPGLKVRDVLPDGPVDRSHASIGPGDVLLAINGQDVDPDMDLAKLLTMRLDSDVRLKFQASDEDDEDDEGEGDDEEEEQGDDDDDDDGVREVTVRPISYGASPPALVRRLAGT